MDYSTDRPINTKEEDLLGRSPFSNQLGKAIYEYNGREGLVIGLFGKWGTGKTSVINMAINKINELSKNKNDKPIIMMFNPWNYSNKNNLIRLFFESLKNKMKLSENKEFKDKVGKALSDYSEAFDALSGVPIIGSSLAAILKTFAKVKGKNLMQTDNLDKTRENLEKALINANNKIIIVIDDIDRLTNSQIRDIFQLVKQVANFPNVIYLLVMERDVVNNALKEIHNIDGNEYLEKIIQIPFELPAIKKENLNNIFFSRLDDVVKKLPNKVFWDQNYWNSIFMNCVEPYINTIRDVNRLINTFQFRYEVLYQETSLEDMVAITTLEVLEPKLYKWIFDNKESVCGGFMHSFNSDEIDYHKLYYEQFNSLGIDPNLSITCVSTMFPVFAKDVNKYNNVYQSTTDIRSKMRVANQDRFELYFMFNPDDIKVSRNIINDCINKFDKDNLKTIIEGINENGNIVYFLEEIKSLVDTIPYERLGLIASVLLTLQDKFEGKSSGSIFSIGAFYLSESLVYDIMKKLVTDKERYEIIRFNLENVEKNGLGTIAEIIKRIELSYGRLAAISENKDGQIISLVQLENLEKIYLEKIQEIAYTESILGINGFYLAFYLWECFDKKGVSNYLGKLFENDINKLKFICSIAGRWNGSHGSGWGFNTEHYSEYISKDEVYNQIKSLDKNKLDDFTEIELIKLASFYLIYKNEEEHIYENEAQKLVDDWKKRQI